MNYPEIDQLELLQRRYDLMVLPVADRLLGDREDFPLVEFFVGAARYEVYVNDEYHDLDANKPLLNLCLVLMSLEDYAEEDDYLTWCKSYGLSAANMAFRNWSTW